MFSSPMNIFAAPQQASLDESRPLVKRSVPQASVATLWAGVVVAGLAVGWCVLDSWNHDVIGQLFGMQEANIDWKTGAITGTARKFEYPLLLALLQFGFMGLAFFALFLLVVPQPLEELAKARDVSFNSGRWHSAGLVLTHVFGIFWLQSLMLPKQMMSLGLFAASRAVEIPTAAGLRARILDPRCGGHPIATTALMFSAAWLLFFAYSQIAECLCIWSGYGVPLTGPALFIVYALVLTLPVANAVCQEACMAQHQMNGILMLALMNMLAFLVFVPIVVVSHISGGESILAGISMIWRHEQAIMLVTWLCVQMAFTAGATTALIHLADSFWAVSLHSLRVVFWWGRQLVAYYLASGGILLSVTQPHSSMWSLVIICGLGLALGAVLYDIQIDQKPALAKSGVKTPSGETQSV